MVSVHLSVCLSVQPSCMDPQQPLPLLEVCSCWPSRQETSIDWCTAGVQQRRRANVDSATLSAYVGSWTQTGSNCLCECSDCMLQIQRRQIPGEHGEVCHLQLVTTRRWRQFRISQWQQRRNLLTWSTNDVSQAIWTAGHKSKLIYVVMCW